MIERVMDAENDRLTTWANDEHKNPYEAHAYRTAAHAIRQAKETLLTALSVASEGTKCPAWHNLPDVDCPRCNDKPEMRAPIASEGRPAETAEGKELRRIQQLAREFRLEDVLDHPEPLSEIAQALRGYEIAATLRCQLVQAEIKLAALTGASEAIRALIQREMVCQQAYADSVEPSAGMTTPDQHRHTASVLRSMLLLIQIQQSASEARTPTEERWKAEYQRICEVAAHNLVRAEVAEAQSTQLHAIGVMAMTAQSDPHSSAEVYRAALIDICHVALKAQDAASEAPPTTGGDK